MAVYGSVGAEELYHYGILHKSGRYPYGSGQEPYQDNPAKRRLNKDESRKKAKESVSQNASKTKSSKQSPATTDKISMHAKDSGKKIQKNADGSSTIPKGYVFNRIGRSEIDPNKAGSLYVSSGKNDAIRYMSYMGPTLMRDILGVSSQSIQHISVKEPLKMASEEQTTRIMANALLKDSDLLKSFNESFYVMATTNNYDKKVSNKDLENALKDPKSDGAKKIAYGVGAFLGNGEMAENAKKVYKDFLDAGYDAIPDIYDRMTGTSESAMIITNPSKLKIDSYEVLTRDMTKKAKRYVKKIGKLPMSQVLK